MKYTKAHKVKMQERRRLIKTEAEKAKAENREPNPVVTAHALERLREYEDHAEEQMRKLNRPYTIRVTVSKKFTEQGPGLVTQDPPTKPGQDADDSEPATEAAPTVEQVKQAFGAGAVKDRYQCDACGKTFTVEADAQQHILLAHTPVHDDGTAWEPPTFREVQQPGPEPETQPGANGGPSSASGTRPPAEPRVTKTRPPLRVPLPPDKLAKVIIAGGYKQELANRAAGFPGMPDMWWPIAEVMLTDYFEELALRGWDLRRFRGIILGGGALVTGVQTVRRMRDGGQRAQQMAAGAQQAAAPKDEQAPDMQGPQPTQQQRETASNGGPAKGTQPSDERYVAGPSKPMGV